MYSSKDVSKLIQEMILNIETRQDIQEVVDYSMAVIDYERAKKKAEILGDRACIKRWMDHYKIEEER